MSFVRYILKRPVLAYLLAVLVFVPGAALWGWLR